MAFDPFEYHRTADGSRRVSYEGDVLGYVTQTADLMYYAVPVESLALVIPYNLRKAVALPGLYTTRRDAAWALVAFKEGLHHPR